MTILRPLAVASFVAAFVAAGHAQQQGAGQDKQNEQSFRFRTGVELINVTATVTDGTGRFVSGLRKEDFRVYEDDELQTITHFSSDRVPVSLGIILDTSGSMEGEKMVAAKRALDRFLIELLGPDDEVFLYRFDSSPELVHGWTTDRRAVSRELAGLRARGGTAMYDAVAEAIPLAQSGKHRKKALVVISDGNDQNSQTAIAALQAQIRETEVLIYAIGIDSQVETEWAPRRPWGGLLDLFTQSRAQARPRPMPFPIPGGKRSTPPPPPRTPPTNPGPRIPVVTTAGGHAAEQPEPDLRLGARQRRGTARHHRRQRRPHGSDPLRSRPRSGHGLDRRRALEAVLHGLWGVGKEGWPLARHPRRAPQRQLPGARPQRLRRDALKSSIAAAADSIGVAEMFNRDSH
jgi:Mg-chelatase subunit ChlD